VTVASDYGINFGFRRSDESMAIREGRFKTPAGSALKLGTAVEIDPAAPGYLKQSAANAVGITRSGFAGILVQEEVHIRSAYEDQETDSFTRGVARADKLSVIYSGAGTKIWLANNAAQTRADGRVIDAVTIVTVTGLAVGECLGWDGSKWVESDGTTIPHWLRVTAVSGSGATGYVEAVLQF
jgi:hypothetical protein